MKQEKKVNSYLRGIKIIALACVIGGVIGGVTGAIRFVLLSRGVAVSETGYYSRSEVCWFQSWVLFLQ